MRNNSGGGKSLIMFDPKTNRYPYPLETDRHYLEIHKDRGLVFDSDYPYIDKSGWFRFKQNMTRIFLNVIVFPVATIRLGLKIEGRENLKKYKDVLDGGVVSVCNHVHMWDYIGVMKGIRPRRSGLLAWAPNINGENGTLIRMVGGIPIPENTVAGQKAFLKAVGGFLKEHGWLHIIKITGLFILFYCIFDLLVHLFFPPEIYRKYYI